MGWYHSHPSHKYWLLGIDVNTQELFQMSADPFLAIVARSHQVSQFACILQYLEKFDMPTFRVHSKGYTEQNLANVKDVPRRKAVDFSYHYKRCYQLSIEFVTNKLGQKTLNNVQKMEQANQLAHSSFVGQSEYLRDQFIDKKLDLEEYLELKENPTAKYAEVKEKRNKHTKKNGQLYQLKKLVLNGLCSQESSLLIHLRQLQKIPLSSSLFNIFNMFEGLLDDRNISHVGVCDSQ